MNFTLLLFLIIIPIIFLRLAVEVLEFSNMSENFRQKTRHKLNAVDINKIVSTPTDCRFAIGFGGPGLDEKATIVIEEDVMKVKTVDGAQKIIKLNDIKRAESSDLGTLIIFPTWTKKLAITNDGRWSIFFGSSIAERGYGSLAFPWAIKGQDTVDADKKAIAYYLKIKQSALKNK